jgi:hypothetical protein
MNTKTEALRTLIKEITPTSIFGVTFVKKDGTIRDMTCRLGVTKYLKGGELGYDVVDKGLLSVYDMTAAGYRMINLDTVTEIRANGNVYRFED